MLIKIKTMSWIVPKFGDPRIIFEQIEEINANNFVSKLLLSGNWGTKKPNKL